MLALAAAIALLTLNLAYQIARKPAELLFPVSGMLRKQPAQTWATYGEAFRRNSTALIPAELLAALAQGEGAGDPLAHTYWRFAWSAHPLELYRPASSAVGMYQLTDAAYAQARHYCIRAHQVVPAADWRDWHGCWHGGLYLRVLPEDAIELTAAYLDLNVAAILRERPRPPPRETERLATLVHLCGPAVAAAYARRGYQLGVGERCGAHDPRAYLKRIGLLRAQFARLAQQEAMGEGRGG
ncbi:MAG: lytic transglycosylase domain-containing protein [Gammaproteobacteria bacterium]|nr:lytic transglycosylase domain-containing protein [Gammaproteobacteria bacterium]